MKNYTGIFVKIVLFDNIEKYEKRSEFHLHRALHHSYSIIFFFRCDVNSRVLPKLEELAQSQQSF